MTLKMTFSHSNGNRLFSQNVIETTYYTSSAICVCQETYFHFSDLGIDFYMTLS